MTTAYPGTQAIVRVLQLLKLFGQDQAEWSLNELVQHTNLNKTTVFRMLTALESEGLIERNERGDYRLGIVTAILGSRALYSNTLSKVARPFLADLAHQSSERVTLETPTLNANGSYSMLILEVFESQYLIQIQQAIGTRLPLHATSTGKAILAFMSADERNAALQTPLAALTEQTVVECCKLEQELENIRRQGYALAIGELEIGLMAAGAPIFDAAGKPIAAVSLESVEPRVNVTQLHELGAAVAETAQKISLRLGHRLTRSLL